ncbi:MAG: zinc dependent phospholipase C family protein [Candidatus Merdivicinus sp.]|jgi:hypothetical protein
MADFLTHKLFGDIVGREAPIDVRQLTEIYPEAFRWGFQGPDPLFFRQHWKEGGRYHKLGNRMHREHIDEMFDAMANHIRRQSGTKKEVLLAYFYGFLCHYALDSEIHPYVYALQKKGMERNPSVSGGVIHCQIETDVDIALYERWEGRQIEEFHPYEGHHLPTGQKWMIGELYETVMLEVYGEVLPAEEIAHSFADMLLTEDFLYRRGKKLGKAAYLAGLVRPEWSDFVSHAKIAAPYWDALNLKKRGWRNPDEPEMLRHESVLEIIAIAEEKALHLMERYVRMFAGEEWGMVHYPVSFDNGNQHIQQENRVEDC